MKQSLMVLAVLILFYAGSNIKVDASGTSTSQMKSNNVDTQSNNSGAQGGSDDVSYSVAALYDQGVAAVKSKDYPKAIDLFEQVLQVRPNNADALNELAHAQRKMGNLDEAIENYWKALKIRPDFAEAREYLGEAYLQGAVKQAKLLKGYGDEGKEQLEDLTKALQEAEDQIKNNK